MHFLFLIQETALSEQRFNNFFSLLFNTTE